MNTDIRIPIGAMFSIVGLILLVYGLMTTGDPMYAKSLGINMNTIWGGVMLAFGVLMFLFGILKREK